MLRRRCLSRLEIQGKLSKTGPWAELWHTHRNHLADKKGRGTFRQKKNTGSTCRREMYCCLFSRNWKKSPSFSEARMSNSCSHRSRPNDGCAPLWAGNLLQGHLEAQEPKDRSRDRTRKWTRTRESGLSLGTSFRLSLSRQVFSAWQIYRIHSVATTGPGFCMFSKCVGTGFAGPA